MSTTQVHRIFINASPDRVWQAITTPEMSALYGYLSPVEYEPRAGGSYTSRASEEMIGLGMPEVVVTGEVLEWDPPRRLVQTWAPVWIEDEEPGTLTWEIEDTADGATRLTLTHSGIGEETASQVAGNPDPSAPGGGGWPWVLSGLKTVLETGRPMEAPAG